ncbi:MAG: hypothetical protein RLZ25_360 [Pseudomonadota bacterium]|jgi:CHASE2 domain-containing sensor protein
MEDLYKHLPTASDKDGIFLLILALGVYLLPGLIAWKRKHRNENPIVVLNIFFGWTLIGWFSALIWSLTSNVKATGVRQCIYCAENIKDAAKICRFCGKDQIKSSVSHISD